MSNFTNSFVPVEVVVNCHNIPHLNSQLKSESNTFGLTYNNLSNSYAESLISLPALIGALGILSLLFLNVVLCVRSCLGICRFVPKETYMDGDTEVRDTKTKQFISIRTLKIWFYIFAAAVVLSDQSVFFGNRFADQAIGTTNKALNFLDNSFENLANDGTTLQTDSVSLQSQIASVQSSGTCLELNAIYPTLQNELNEFNTDTQNFNNFVDPLPGYINDVQNNFKKYVTNYKNDSIWILYVLVLISVSIYCGGLWFKSKCVLQIGIGFTQFLMLVLIVLCAIEMVVVMGLSDFCMSPTLNTLQLLDPGSEFYPLVSYYTTCVGQNPVDSPLSGAYSAINELNANLEGLQIACPGDFTESLAISSDIQQTLYAIGNVTACTPLQSQANDLLQNGLCYQTFLGLFVIWASQYVTCLCLFLLTIVVSITYQYFGRYWDMEAQQKEDERGLSYANEEFRNPVAQVESGHATGATPYVAYTERPVNFTY